MQRFHLDNRFLRPLGKAARRLWRDERGIVHASQAILLMSIMCLGMIVGVESLKSHLVQEFGDAGLALENLNQSYQYTLYDQDGNVLHDPDGDGFSAKFEDTVGALAPVEVFPSTDPPTLGGDSPGKIPDGENYLLDRTRNYPGSLGKIDPTPEGGTLDPPMGPPNGDSPLPVSLPPGPEGSSLP